MERQQGPLNNIMNGVQQDSQFIFLVQKKENLCLKEKVWTKAEHSIHIQPTTTNFFNQFQDTLAVQSQYIILELAKKSNKVK